MSDQKCCESVQDSISRQFHRCSRKGVAERNGKQYCRQHDPGAIRARNAERYQKYIEQFRRPNAIAALLDGIPTEVLESPGFAAMVREAAARFGGAKTSEGS